MLGFLNKHVLFVGILCHFMNKVLANADADEKAPAEKGPLAESSFKGPNEVGEAERAQLAQNKGGQVRARIAQIEARANREVEEEAAKRVQAEKERQERKERARVQRRAREAEQERARVQREKKQQQERAEWQKEWQKEGKEAVSLRTISTRLKQACTESGIPFWEASVARLEHMLCCAYHNRPIECFQGLWESIDEKVKEKLVIVMGIDDKDCLLKIQSAKLDPKRQRKLMDCGELETVGVAFGIAKK